MSELRTWLRALPKAELHVHLEGTVSPESYRRIAQRNGVDIPAEPSDLYRCSDFASFLKAFVQVVRALQKPRDFAELASEYLEKSVGEGVRHVEFFVSPATTRYFFKGADLEGIVAAIHESCERACTAHGISSLVIFDMVRNLGEESAVADIELAKRCAHHGVVGIGLGGDERRFPACDFQKVFASAQRLGLRRTVHAGEADGPRSIVDAVELLHAERVGHAVAAGGNRDVIELLRVRGVAVDACLTSNKITGAWNPATVHPVVEFIVAGVDVTLSSDDPAFFGASLLDEYERAADLGLERSALVKLARASFERSFAAEEKKRTWLAELDAFVEAGLKRE